MSGLQLALLAGLLAGGGGVLGLWWLLPVRPALGVALDRVAGVLPAVGPLAPAASGDGQERLGAWFARRLPTATWATPVRELRLLRVTPESFYGEKLILAGIGIVAPPLLSTLCAVLGLGLPLAVPLGGAVAASVGLFFLPNLDIGSRAKAARLEFNHALSSLIDLVALERRAGSGARQALENAARTGRGHWVFDRITEGLTESSHDGRRPWEVFHTMADELGLPELDDLANIMALAEEQSMPVYQTLREHNRALRTALLTDEQTRANKATERLTIPGVFLAGVFVAILLGPSLMTLFGTT